MIGPAGSTTDTLAYPYKGYMKEPTEEERAEKQETQLRDRVQVMREEEHAKDRSANRQQAVSSGETGADRVAEQRSQEAQEQENQPEQSEPARNGQQQNQREWIA